MSKLDELDKEMEEKFYPYIENGLGYQVKELARKYYEAGKQEGYERAIEIGKPSWYKEGKIDGRVEEREAMKKLVDDLKCEVPSSPVGKLAQEEITEDFLNKALLWVGRFNYNKALSDLLNELK